MTNTSEVNHQSDRLPDSENMDYRVSTEDFSVEFSVGSLADTIGLDEENIDQREAILSKYSEECLAEIERLTSHADNLDLLASVCCGVAAGVIDTIFVGKWDFSSAKAISNEEMNRMVTDFAKKNPKYG